MDITDGGLVAGLNGGHGNSTDCAQLAILASPCLLLVSIRVQHMRWDFPQHNLNNKNEHRQIRITIQIRNNGLGQPDLAVDTATNSHGGVERIEAEGMDVINGFQHGLLLQAREQQVSRVTSRC